MRLQKLHGLGNDFLVLLDDGTAPPVDPGVAKALCARRTGVGADGLVRVTRSAAGITFELWNADGSTAEVSGNGLRCVGLACLRAGWWSGEAPLAVATAAGTRTVERDGDQLRVAMGPVVVQGRSPHGATWVMVGNPHEVHLLDGELDAVDLLAAPADRNVEWVVAGPGPDEIRMRVHERGAGETLACGSGSVAAAVVAHAAGWVGPTVTVHNPGGSVVVALDGDQPTLTGPAVHVADVEVEVAP